MPSWVLVLAGIETNRPEDERARADSPHPHEHRQLKAGAGLTDLTRGLGNQLGVDPTAEELIATTPCPT